MTNQICRGHRIHLDLEDVELAEDLRREDILQVIFLLRFALDDDQGKGTRRAVILLVENWLIFLRGSHNIFKLIKTSNYTSSKVRSQRRKF